MNCIKIVSYLFIYTHIGLVSAGLPEALSALKHNDFDSAILELRPLAKQESPEVQVLLAQVLISINKNSHNISEAIDLLRKAAESGQQQAMLMLVNIHDKVETSEVNEQEIIKWLRQLAEQNNQTGLMLLAKKYADGQGVPQSEIISRALYSKAIFSGHDLPEVNDVDFGPIRLALISKLLAEMRKPANFQKALDTANVEAIHFNRNYADLPSAVRWGILDAEAGNNKVILELGTLYLYGRNGVPLDPKRAAFWFQKAASNGNQNARGFMAHLYLEGVGVERNLGEAFKLFTELEQEKYPGAAAVLGVMYKNGLGVPRDITRALILLRKSVGGVGEDLYPLAQMYSEGLGVEQNLVVALALARYAESFKPHSFSLEFKAENPAALLVQELKSKLSPHDIAVSGKLAVQLVTAKLEGRLLTAIDLAAERTIKDYEIPPAEVASHFLHDHRDENFSLALSLLVPLVQSGNPAAQYLLGYMYEEGKGVPIDAEKASRLFELAEKQDNVDALTRKATSHELGRGVPQNFSIAFSTFEKAAKRGGAFAQVKVAEMLADGKGVERDTVEAEFWYEQALANRTDYWHARAKNGLAKIRASE